MSGTAMVARSSDSEGNGGLRFALDRLVERINKVEVTADTAERVIDRHTIECRAAYAEFRRDLADVSKNVKELSDLIWRAIYIGLPALGLMFLVQVLGVERAFTLTDSLKQLKLLLP